MQYQISESVAFWLQTALALLVFSVSGAFIGVDFSKAESIFLLCAVDGGVAEADCRGHSNWSFILGLPVNRKEAKSR